jgi:hypothetical protein
VTNTLAYFFVIIIDEEKKFYNVDTNRIKACVCSRRLVPIPGMSVGRIAFARNGSMAEKKTSLNESIRKDCFQNKSKFITEDQFTEHMNITTR